MQRQRRFDNAAQGRRASGAPWVTVNHAARYPEEVTHLSTTATIRILLTAAALGVLALAQPPANAAGQKLYGVHWWDYTRDQPLGPGPTGGWSTETVLTHSDPWWQAWWFQPLYQQANTAHDAAFITRVDYNWGETVPAPTNPDGATWASHVAGVAGALGDWAHVWVVGNEPNIIGEGNGWAGNQITPAGYASVYAEVRSAIKATRPQDEVLVAGPSPGHVIPGVRWKAGNEWLSETIAAIMAIPGAEIDGFALHAYGNPFAPAAQAVAEFHADYASQLAVIDSHGLKQASAYLTEWNRSTSTTGNLAANEQVTADFIRGAMADVNAWNQGVGNHNIVAMTWFVNEQGGGGWNQYSLEYWKSVGNPLGHPGDLWTALMEGSQYAAGVRGVRVPEPAGFAMCVLGLLAAGRRRRGAWLRRVPCPRPRGHVAFIWMSLFDHAHGSRLPSPCHAVARPDKQLTLRLILRR